MERKKNKFELLADKVTQWSGSSYVFGIATVILGRPVGSKSSKTKLFGQEKKIQELIDKHV